MNFFLALSPILLILYLMVGRRWSAAQAGAAGYLAGVVIAWLFFGATPELLAYAHARALLFSLDVLLIIWAAFLLYRVADEAGAIRIIGQALPRLTLDRGMQALIIGWVFASFLQGVGGFGVPVAVTAPLLIGIGLPPLAAVVVPSLGHSWGVTLGSMGSSFQALMAATSLPAETLGPPASLFLSLTCPLIGVMAAHSMEGWAGVRRLWLPSLIWGVVMGTVQFLVVLAGAWNIATFVAGLAGLLVTPLVLRLVAPRASRRAAAETDPAPEAQVEWRRVLIAVSSYVIIIIVTLSVQLIPALKAFLSPVILHFDFPEIRSATGFITPPGAGRSINLFAHTGSLLFYAAAISYLVYLRFGCYQPGSLRRVLGGTLQRVMTSSVSIVSMIALSQVMELTGMTFTLARGLADSFGAVFPLVAPWIGAIGAIMTGSNTNSNVVFGALQLKTALLLSLPPAIILAAQSSGGALASTAAPAKVVVGCSTAGMTGKEGEVLRRLAAYIAILIALISLMSWIGVSLY
ncbi:MAG: L-lactate permease [Anaerolineales bacterium]|nr:L-lactate permease [Anaerolineales bacterium]